MKVTPNVLFASLSIMLLVLIMLYVAPERYTPLQMNGINDTSLDSLYFRPDQSPKADVFRYTSPSEFVPKILSYAYMGPDSNDRM
jgi:hypothetical protein